MSYLVRMLMDRSNTSQREQELFLQALCCILAQSLLYSNTHSQCVLPNSNLQATSKRENSHSEYTTRVCILITNLIRPICSILEKT